MEQKQLIGFCIILVALFSCYLLLSIMPKTHAGFYDNSSIESKVNVTNIAPFITQVNIYEADDLSEVDIDLTEGTTESVVCNGTVNDWNGRDDIADYNATIYDSDSYNSSSGTDNNYNYFQGTCTNSVINNTAIEISCSFDVWYYANDATWNCNVTARDTENTTGTGVDSSPPVFNTLAALNLSTLVVDFGEMQPGQITSDADEKPVNVTNTGNTEINLSVDGYGVSDGDGLAMDCNIGNISVDNIRYNITASQDFNTSMWNLTDTKLSQGIPGFQISRRTDDSDTQKIKSTNSTFWKLRVPVGSKGFCNGTIVFSAVV